MEIIRDIAHVGEKSFAQVAAAIGTFDGVHAGHQRIIGKVVERARRTKATAAALTFVNHPLDVLQPDRAPRLITPSPLKERLLRTLGLDLLIAIPFTASLAEMGAEAFVGEILWEKLRVDFLCIGFDFRFGRGRAGTPDLLAEMGKTLGFEVEVVPAIAVEGTPSPLKERLLRTLGLDLLIAIPFTASLAEMGAEAFVGEILWEKLRVDFLCIGFDFRFGRGRAGTPDLLAEMGKTLGFEVEVVPAIAVEGTVVKSALIRDLLQQGKVSEAARYLTRPYAIVGEIVPGAGRGKGLGFATANVPPPHDFLIPDGVYAGQAFVGERGYNAAINVGVAPTFGGRDRRVEVHLLDLQDDRAPGYGGSVLVTFWERIREEVRFTSPEELKAQVALDIRRARDILSQPAPADWALQG